MSVVILLASVVAIVVNLIVIVIASLVVVVILLVIMFRPEHRPHPPSQKRGGADRLLNLDETQHEIFLASAEKHKANIIQLNEDQKALIYQYFKTISKSAEDAATAACLCSVENFQKSTLYTS